MARAPLWPAPSPCPSRCPSYSSDVQTIWNRCRCTGCHGTSGGLSLGGAPATATWSTSYLQRACTTLKRVAARRSGQLRAHPQDGGHGLRRPHARRTIRPTSTEPGPAHPRALVDPRGRRQQLMSQHRIRGLESVDPLSVPLPHGTEVTTRVARVLGQSAASPRARWAASSGAREGGLRRARSSAWAMLRYAREELVPRKPGQVQFAQRRAAAWDALRPCVVLEATVGSRAWGLAHEGSDTDLRGVFAPAAVLDAGAWASRRGISSAPTAAPRTGSAARPSTRRCAPIPTRSSCSSSPPRARSDVLGEWLLAERDAFVSARHLRQLRPLRAVASSTSSCQLAAPRRAPRRRARLAARGARAGAGRGGRAARAALAAPGAHARGRRSSRPRTYIKQLYRSLSRSGPHRGQRLRGARPLCARRRQAPAEPPRELRPKNAYNLLRLIALATGLAARRRARLRGRRARCASGCSPSSTGEVPLEEVLQDAEALAPELEAARDKSPLPEHPDYARADRLLRRAGEELRPSLDLEGAGPLGTRGPRIPRVRLERYPARARVAPQVPEPLSAAATSSATSIISSNVSCRSSGESVCPRRR